MFKLEALRRSTTEHQRNCSSDAVMKELLEGASAATPHALHESSSTKLRSQAKSGLANTDCLCAK